MAAAQDRWMQGMMVAMKLASQQLVTGVGPVGPGTVTIDAGRISAVTAGIQDDAERVLGWLVPGFVDTHCHGGAGAAFTDPDPQAVQRAIDLHRRHGSTSLFASTVTSPLGEVAAQVRRLRSFVKRGELAGVHLEGPFLSERFKGAHDPKLLVNPTQEALVPLLDAGRDAIKMVTLAPERPTAMVAINELASLGVMPAFGHSDADASQAREAVDSGATVVTHLFNAMRGIHHRDPGPIPFLLTDERVNVELICDGVHVCSDVLRLAIQTAGTDRVLLMTDAMSATGCADGNYLLGDLDVVVQAGVARIALPDGSQGSIAGSTLTMDKAVEFVVNQLGCDVPHASQMASTNPARVHGLDHVGRIAPGCWADLCILDRHAKLQGVLRHGEWIDRS